MVGVCLSAFVHTYMLCSIACRESASAAWGGGRGCCQGSPLLLRPKSRERRCAEEARRGGLEGGRGVVMSDWVRGQAGGVR
jgi:hypothetical protein